MDQLFKLGKNGEYTLNRRALNHIAHGDFTTRVDRQETGLEPILTKILSGGLHTYTALKSFLNEHTKITSLDAFDPSINEDWFYIRELQNKVITVKIPQTLFSGKAANLTQKPETYYKSGYLWKTLFPKDFSETQIIDCIDQALKNIDKENSATPSSPETDYHLIGYANTHDPMTAIRIQVQLHGNEIRSAFPSWSQPWTGNNGKAFSHADSISFILSESTEPSSGDHYKLSSIFSDGKPKYEKLKKLTPTFTTTKTIPKLGKPQDLWRTNRLEVLKALAYSIETNELQNIQSYLCDHIITKEPSYHQQALYMSGIPHFTPLDFNTCQLSQNIYECFFVLLQYDIKNNTSHFLECMQRFLLTTVIHTGGIHLFELKRLHKLFISGSLLHHRRDSVKLFLEALSNSPSRAATYHEFDMNTYNKKHDENSMLLIGTDNLILPIEPEMIIDFVALNLGENYLITFDKTERNKIAKKLIFSQIPEQYIADSLSYFTGSDFNFFALDLPLLLEKENKETASDKTLERIIRDYHRMLVIYRQRLVLDDPDSYKANPFEYEFMSSEFCELTIQQHKRKYVIAMHQHFLKNTSIILKSKESKKLSSLCEILQNSIGKEGVPLPQQIPDYIESWMQNVEYQKTKKDFDLSIFER